MRVRILLIVLIPVYIVLAVPLGLIMAWTAWRSDWEDECVLGWEGQEGRQA